MSAEVLELIPDASEDKNFRLKSIKFKIKRLSGAFALERSMFSDETVSHEFGSLKSVKAVDLSSSMKD